MDTITAAVGNPEAPIVKNRPEDVKKVQKLLKDAAKIYNDSRLKPGTETTIISAESSTVKALKHFQKKHLKFKRSRGVVRPGKITMKRLSLAGKVEDTLYEPFNIKQAPWMKVARNEFEKGIFEFNEGDNPEILGDNPEILKYLRSTNFFGYFDKHGSLSREILEQREWYKKRPERFKKTIDKRYINRSKDETAWCASFVTWVLEQSGHDTVKSTRGKDEHWLDEHWLKYHWLNDANVGTWKNFGRKLSEPYFGAITITKRRKKPFAHITFFVCQDEKYIWALGGNQGNRIRLSRYHQNDVTVYRWPYSQSLPWPLISFDWELIVP